MDVSKKKREKPLNWHHFSRNPGFLELIQVDVSFFPSRKMSFQIDSSTTSLSYPGNAETTRISVDFKGKRWKKGSLNFFLLGFGRWIIIVYPCLSQMRKIISNWFVVSDCDLKISIYPKKCWVKLDHKTPPKNNLEPENKPVWKDHHFARLHFLGWIFVFRGVVFFSWFIHPLLQLVGKTPRPHCSTAWWPRMERQQFLPPWSLPIMSDAPWGHYFGGRYLYSHNSINRYYCTPLKINMEPKNHPIEKENHLNQTSISRFSQPGTWGWHSHLRHGRDWWCSPGWCLGRWGHLEGESQCS